ncbi:SRPBCC family protein [Nocardia sp. NPDC057030]|uniref:SRPBCC family protein n=1 Tax=unclassified Nocardia TaxID=2637762 RepID=UPI003629DD4E
MRTLPVRHIDTRIDVAVPPERVWAVLIDFAAYPEWNPFFVAVDGVAEPGAELSLHTKFSARRAPRIFSVTVYVVEAPRTLLWGGGFAIPRLADGRHGFDLSPDGDGTDVRHHEQLSGLIIPFAGKQLTDLEQRYRELNQALKERAENITPPG